jgi:transposase
MITFCGLDVHKRVVEACVLDESGQIVHRQRFDMTPADLTAFARQHLGPEAKVVVEATSNTWAVVRLLKPLVDAVLVSNPMQTKAIAQAKVKTDKVDAWVLAHLLRLDFLPLVWEPDEATQRLRQLTRRRAALVGMQTAIKNRLHSVLAERLLTPPVELFSNKGLAWLRALELDDIGRLQRDSDLRLFDDVAREITVFDQALAEKAYADDQVKLLMTLPGVSVTVAQTLLAALGKFDRFRDADHAAAYLGLVPRVKQSANRCHHGSITKAGSSQARSMMIQAAQSVGRHPGPLGHFFRRLAKKKNHNIAVVATARKLVVIAWHMMTKNEPYRYALPAVTEAKIQRLRVRATGHKRKTGPRKDAAGKYQTGASMRMTKALAQVFADEGLPPLGPVPPGEAHTIAQTGSVEYFASLQKPQVRRRGVRKAPAAQVALSAVASATCSNESPSL